MKPMYALHKDGNGSILTAASFTHDFELGQFIRNADIRPGDSIHFGEAIKREADAPEPLPAFLSEEEPPASTALGVTEPVDGELQPF